MKPNLFVVGAAKSGTSTLHSVLNSHPAIYMSPIKEPHFFAKEIRPDEFSLRFKRANKFDAGVYFSQNPLQPLHAAFIQNRENYFKLFREASVQKYWGEASPSYLFSETAPREIANFHCNAKIIIILRDPVERIISHYQMDVLSGLQEEKDIYKGVMRDFGQEKKGWGISHLYIELSKYQNQVKNYLRIFDASNVLILDFALLKSNPGELFEQISAFLDVPNYFKMKIVKKNETVMPNNWYVKSLLNLWQKVKFFETSAGLKKLFLEKFFSRPEIVITEKFDEEIREILKEELEYYHSLFNALK
ncbi:MAG: sulfotransferase [Bacteroidales bacterium]|nr:sulfotransferase [Bacteroidales bacterium]